MVRPLEQALKEDRNIPLPCLMLNVPSMCLKKMDNLTVWLSMVKYRHRIRVTWSQNGNKVIKKWKSQELEKL